MRARKLPIVLAMTCLASAYALGAAPEDRAKSLPHAKNVATLGELDAEDAQDSTTVTARFDQKPAWEKPLDLQDHGTFLQLILPSVVVPEPGKFFDGAGPYVKKIAVFQLTPSDAGIRLFLDGNARRAKEAASVALLDKRIVMTFDHALMPAPPLVGPPAPERAPGDAALGSAADVVKKTTVRNEPLPSDLLRQDKGGAKASAFKVGGIDLKSKLVQVTVFSGIMLLIMALALMAKPWLRRRAARAAGEAPPLTMKTIASLPLAARQKISLIQVGEERILIGVTPDNVTFLTMIGANNTERSLRAAPTVAPAFSRMLQESTGENVREKRLPPPEPRAKARVPSDELPAEGSVQKPERKAKPAAIPEPPAKTPVESQPKPRPAPKRINLAVGDDGVKNLAEGKKSQEAIDDVTKMIREKLKGLRTIS